MPKPIQPPAPAYGSPEWKAERERMVGTPEWRAIHGQAPDRTLQSGQAGGVIPGGQFGVFEYHGKPLTTAEKQAQNPLYNPLYDPRSAEYKTNLVNVSNPNQNPANPMADIGVESFSTKTGEMRYSNPTIQNPLVQPPNAPVTTPQIPPLQPQPQGPIVPQQQTPKITLPQQFQQNYNMPPGSPQQPNQGIKMPNINREGFTGGGNWSDFLTVALNNRYQR